MKKKGLYIGFSILTILLAFYLRGSVVVSAESTDTKISIPDEGFKLDLLAALNSTDESDLTVENLSTISSLNIEQGHILEGLQYMVNLKTMKISSGVIDNFNRAAKLPITKLVMTSSKLEDPSSLKQLTMLSELELNGDTGYQDTRFLYQLPNLKSLGIYLRGEVNEMDFSGVNSLEKLESLALSGEGKISDKNPLSKVSGESIHQLNNLTNLKHIILTSMNIQVLPSFSGSSDIVQLMIQDIPLKNIDSLSHMSHMIIFISGNTLVNSIPDLSSLSELEHVGIQSSPIINYDELQSIPNKSGVVVNLSDNLIQERRNFLSEFNTAILNFNFLQNENLQYHPTRLTDTVVTTGNLLTIPLTWSFGNNIGDDMVIDLNQLTSIKREFVQNLIPTVEVTAPIANIQATAYDNLSVEGLLIGESKVSLLYTPAIRTTFNLMVN